MRLRNTTLWCLAFGLTLGALGVAPAAAAQLFTDNIKIASKFPTLQDAIDAAGEGGMLIVDQDYQNLSPLVLPRRFRMTGKGPLGNAVLAFQGLAAGSAITIAPSGDAYVVIEDLDIEGSFAPGNGFATSARGIDLTNSNIVFLRHLVVRGFAFGVYGENSMSVFVDNCSVSVNRGDNYQITSGSNGWRITGGLSSQAGRYAFNIGVVNDTLIQGVRMESNTAAGIFTQGVGTHIAHNRFECWVHPDLPFCLATTKAVIIGQPALETTLVDNLYAGIDVVDQSTAKSTYRFDNGHPVKVSGDVYVSTIGKGVILRSPNGSCFRMTVSNAGLLGSAAVACP